MTWLISYGTDLVERGIAAVGKNKNTWNKPAREKSHMFSPMCEI